MMPDVKVAAICLTADRPRETARAIRCFVEQTYPRELRRLYILDSGQEPMDEDGEYFRAALRVKYFRYHNTNKIGELRNVVNEIAYTDDHPDVFMHWDSDDWYSPSYMAAQIARLDHDICAIGFNSVLFFDCEKREVWRYDHSSTSYAIGASLTYWASCWKVLPFEAISAGEDTRWLRNMKTRGFTGIDHLAPDMIATIHAGNTSTHQAFSQRNLSGNHNHWTRMPEWDAYAAKVLEMK